MCQAADESPNVLRLQSAPSSSLSGRTYMDVLPTLDSTGQPYDSKIDKALKTGIKFKLVEILTKTDIVGFTAF
jgi:hypothetical protein